MLLAFDRLTWRSGRDVVPRFMIDAYKSARATGALPLIFIAVVVVAPITEEIAFRGFLFRGLARPGSASLERSRPDLGRMVAMHVQYDSAILAQIFRIGLLLGWLRWASGSSGDHACTCSPTSRPAFRRRSRWSGWVRPPCPPRLLTAGRRNPERKPV